MELSFITIPFCVNRSLCHPGYGLLHGGSWDLSIATHQGLQDGIVDEDILILTEKKTLHVYWQTIHALKNQQVPNLQGCPTMWLKSLNHTGSH